MNKLIMMGRVVAEIDGVVKKIDEEKATKWMKSDKVTFLCELKQGREGATAWGCDLTHDYVNINGDYRS